MSFLPSRPTRKPVCGSSPITKAAASRSKQLRLAFARHFVVYGEGSTSRCRRRLGVSLPRWPDSMGTRFPLTSPIPAGTRRLASAWRAAWPKKRGRAVTRHSDANQPLSIAFHFAAASEPTARAIADWLKRHGQEQVELQSPTEADADDWIIRASTPRTRWSRTEIERWAAIVRDAPLAGEASFMGWGV